MCCGDGDHCCPSGYTCDQEKPACVKGNLQIPWFTKQLAVSTQGSEVTSSLGDVKCDDTTRCPAGTTCCRLNTGTWGCCPLVQVCLGSVSITTHSLTHWDVAGRRLSPVMYNFYFLPCRRCVARTMSTAVLMSTPVTCRTKPALNLPTRAPLHSRS